jgi:NADH-quinone oxidoreductase subunit M
VWLPLVSYFFVLVSNQKETQNAKLTAMCGALAVLIISFLMLYFFDFSKNTVQFLEEYTWIPKYNIKYKIGIDRYSIFFILMTATISLLTMLWILRKDIHKTKHFFASILLVESFAIGAFVSYDLFLMLFFMEATAIPLLVMMHLSGKENHIETASVFLIYGIIGSLCTLIAMLMMHNISATSDIIELYQRGDTYGRTCFWLLLMGVGIKIPLFPLHHWVPRVHVDSPTACSVFLASVILKLSSIMMIRIVYHLFFDYLVEYTNLLSCVCLTGAIISCSNIFFQKDLKRIFVYFSILHMNIYIMILLSSCGIGKFVFSVLYHSFIRATLFFVTDIIGTIFKTRDTEELRKVSLHFIEVKRLIFMSILMLIGIPPSWGFVTEIISVYSINCISTYYAFIAVAIILISSTYMFFLYQLIFGNWTISTINSIGMFHTSNAFKKIALYTLFCLTFGIGICSRVFL